MVLEELPARYVTDSMNQLADKVGNWLETMKINYRELKAFSTPRRLALLVLDVAVTQEDVQKKQKVQLKKLLKMMMVNGQKQRLDFHVAKVCL